MCSSHGDPGTVGRSAQVPSDSSPQGLSTLLVTYTRVVYAVVPDLRATPGDSGTGCFRISTTVDNSCGRPCGYVDNSGRLAGAARCQVPARRRRRHGCAPRHDACSGIKSYFNRVIHNANNLWLAVKQGDSAPDGAGITRNARTKPRYPQLWISCGYWSVVKWITPPAPAIHGKTSAVPASRLPSAGARNASLTYPQGIHTVNNPQPGASLS